MDFWLPKATTLLVRCFFLFKKKKNEKRHLVLDFASSLLPSFKFTCHLFICFFHLIFLFISCFINLILGGLPGFCHGQHPQILFNSPSLVLIMQKYLTNLRNDKPALTQTHILSYSSYIKTHILEYPFWNRG